MVNWKYMEDLYRILYTQWLSATVPGICQTPPISSFTAETTNIWLQPTCCSPFWFFSNPAPAAFVTNQMRSYQQKRSPYLSNHLHSWEWSKKMQDFLLVAVWIRDCWTIWYLRTSVNASERSLPPARDRERVRKEWSASTSLCHISLFLGCWNRW